MSKRARTLPYPILPFRFPLFKVASRSCLVATGVILMILSVIGKLGAFLSTMPDPVVGGSMFVTFGIIAALGIFTLNSVDLTSSRNLAVFGMSLYSGIVIPEWLSRNPDGFDTGSDFFCLHFSVCSTCFLFLSQLPLS